jgi:hypothetical protein
MEDLDTEEALGALTTPSMSTQVTEVFFMLRVWSDGLDVGIPHAWAPGT